MKSEIKKSSQVQSCLHFRCLVSVLSNPELLEKLSFSCDQPQYVGQATRYIQECNAELSSTPVSKARHFKHCFWHKQCWLTLEVGADIDFLVQLAPSALDSTLYGHLLGDVCGFILTLDSQIIIFWFDPAILLRQLDLSRKAFFDELFLSLAPDKIMQEASPRIHFNDIPTVTRWILAAQFGVAFLVGVCNWKQAPILQWLLSVFMRCALA